MGKFAEGAVKFEPTQRGDGHCASGKWIEENFDEEDLVEFARLANGHNWTRIVRLSGRHLSQKTLILHVHGTCVCFDGVPGKGCCTSCDMGIS